MTINNVGDPLTLSIIGAGRLGARLAERWSDASGSTPTLWSRRFEAKDVARARSPLAPATRYRVVSWDEIFEADVVLVAIPGSALVSLGDRSPSLRSYKGLIASANLDARIDDLQGLSPQARVARFAPYLLPGRSDIPSLATMNNANQTESTGDGIRALRMLGPLDVVDDETAYETLLVLGSPYPTVLYHALTAAIARFSDAHALSEDARAVGERTFWQAMAAIATNALEPPTSRTLESVATPGGITAKGLSSMPQLIETACELINTMAKHSDMLRDRLRG